MSFPVSPISGQSFTNTLGTRFLYDSTRNAWLIDTQAVTGFYGATGIMGSTGIQGITGTASLIRADGGFANSVYLPLQHLDGGGA